MDLTRRHLAQHAPHINLDVVGSGADVLARVLPDGSAPSDFDVILLDYRMPSVDALELVKALRLERGVRLPIVLVTGQGSEEVAVQALRLGVDDYVVKREGYLSRLRVVLENVQAQAELRRAEKRYRELFSSLRDVVVLADNERIIVDVNQPALRELFGYELGEVVGNPTSVLYADAEQFARAGREIFEHRARAEGKLLEVPFRRKTGEVFEAELTALKLLDDSGEPAGNIGVIRDITARRAAAEELQASTARFRALVESAPDAIYVQSGGRFAYLNDAAVRLFGAAHAEDLLGTSVVDRRPPAFRDASRERIRRLNEERKASRTIHEVVLRMDGSPVDIELSAVPIEYEGAPGALVFARDVGERIEGERRRQVLEDQLRHAQKMESVGRLAGGVAHDFNNILSVIMGYAKLALDKTRAADPLREDLQEIHAAATRSADITRQFLAFARKETISPVTLDLNDAVERMLKMLRRLVGEDIDVAWLPHQGLWPVLMDPSQIDQLLANLCVNARDAITDVGRITIATGVRAIDAPYCAEHPDAVPGDFVLLSVTDTGRGMTPETLKLIFEPFFTTKGPGRGTGLGLSTVYGIVRQNGGFIDVQSEPGRGTSFSLHLPRHHATVNEPLQATNAPAPPMGRGETILIVEDEEAIARLTTRILSESGYRVLTAHSPSEALKAVEAHSSEIALLLTDVVMPEMNGRELADRLRASHPSLRTLFMSGYTADAIAHRGVLETGLRFLQKPFSPEDLAAKVREALDAP